jgi:hypothetical protein
VTAGGSAFLHSGYAAGHVGSPVRRQGQRRDGDRTGAVEPLRGTGHAAAGRGPWVVSRSGRSESIRRTLHSATRSKRWNDLAGVGGQGDHRTGGETETTLCNEFVEHRTWILAGISVDGYGLRQTSGAVRIGEPGNLGGHPKGPCPPGDVVRAMLEAPEARGGLEGLVPLSRLALRGLRATCDLAPGLGLLRRGGRKLLASAALCGQKGVRVMREGAP